MLQIKQAHLSHCAHKGIYVTVHETMKSNSIPTCDQIDGYDKKN